MLVSGVLDSSGRGPRRVRGGKRGEEGEEGEEGGGGADTVAHYFSSRRLHY